MGHNKPNLTTPKKAPENMLAGNFLYDVIAYEEYYKIVHPTVLHKHMLVGDNISSIFSESLYS